MIESQVGTAAWVGFPHVLSARQFSRSSVEELCRRADTMVQAMDDPVERDLLHERFPRKLLITLFYEPSTRTRTSFEAAGIHLGMGIISTENAREFSSAIKGETLEDTIRTIGGYRPDVIAMRHHEAGAAERAAQVSDGVPIVNAGDGNNEHPTQTLLDLYTIFREMRRLDNLRIIMGGDLANGRTVRSLATLLAQFDGISIGFVSPPQLPMRDDVLNYLSEQGVQSAEYESLSRALSEIQPHVLYWTRVQKERFLPALIAGGVPEEDAPREASALYEDVKDRFVIGPEEMTLLPHDAILMHPLPRNSEISVAVDRDPRSAYFRQAANGLPVRMALIDWILESGALAA